VTTTCARASRPSTCSGRTVSPDGSAPLPPLQRAPLPPAGTPRASAVVDVEAAGALLLREDVADRLGAVVDGEGADLVVPRARYVAGSELDGLDRIRQVPEDAPQRP
jgi:hypothetical protein